MNLTRRRFIQHTAAATSILTTGLTSPRRILGNHTLSGPGYPLKAPPEITGGTLEVTAESKEVWPGFPTSVLAINKISPGATIRMKRGETFKARVLNRLAEPLVFHWHGILAPSKMDGNPRDAVPPGGRI